ncbi:MAG: COG2426 family protein [Nanobdellota archaeon]
MRVRKRKMLKQILIVFFATFVPWIELRGAIPLGMVYGLPWYIAFLVAVLANLIVAIFAFFILREIVVILRKISFFDRIYSNYIEKLHKRAHGYVEKYGIIGLGLFIGIPLPGSGVYSGSVVAEIFGIRFRDYFIACIIGVFIAGSIITFLSLTGISLFGLIEGLFYK